MGDVVFAIGRVILPILFIVEGVYMFADVAPVADLLAKKGIPAPQELQTYLGLPPYQALGYMVAGLELVGGICILVGFFTRTFAVLLFLFTAGTIYVSHDFWNMTGGARLNEQIQALKNLSIMGGFLLLAAVGGGRFSLDGRRRRLTY